MQISCPIIEKITWKNTPLGFKSGIKGKKHVDSQFYNKIETQGAFPSAHQ